MGNVRLNIENDLLLQKFKSSLSSKSNGRENHPSIRHIDHIYFVICNSCYWCASYFSIDDLDSLSHVLRCHLCDSRNTELIPIASNESFRIDYNMTRGMEMEFYRNNVIVDRLESTEQRIIPPVNS